MNELMKGFETCYTPRPTGNLWILTQFIIALNRTIFISQEPNVQCEQLISKGGIPAPVVMRQQSSSSLKIYKTYS
jgi:hypothetical protein